MVPQTRRALETSKALAGRMGAAAVHELVIAAVNGAVFVVAAASDALVLAVGGGRVSGEI